MNCVNYECFKIWLGRVQSLFPAIPQDILLFALTDLVYRKHRPVYWSPSSVSALAEAEVQYVDDHVSQASYIRFPFVAGNEVMEQLRESVGSLGNVQILDFLIWTTTPWTIPANMVTL